MLPTNVKEVLKKNISFCFPDEVQGNTELIATEDSIQYFQKEVGVRRADSAFIDYYTFVAMPVKGNGEELLTLDEMLGIVEDKYWDEDYPDFSETFLQLSSMEGEGSYFYNKKTDEVFDVNWGEEEDLVAGKLKPMFVSFYDFLAWYYR